jgi:hypothetical protein
MAAGHGLSLPAVPPVLNFARFIEAYVWQILPVE